MPSYSYGIEDITPLVMNMKWAATVGGRKRNYNLNSVYRTQDEIYEYCNRKSAKSGNVVTGRRYIST